MSILLLQVLGVREGAPGRRRPPTQQAHSTLASLQPTGCCPAAEADPASPGAPLPERPVGARRDSTVLGHQGAGGEWPGLASGRGKHVALPVVGCSGWAPLRVWQFGFLQVE